MKRATKVKCCSGYWCVELSSVCVVSCFPCDFLTASLHLLAPIFRLQTFVWVFRGLGPFGPDPRPMLRDVAATLIVGMVQNIAA